MLRKRVSTRRRLSPQTTKHAAIGDAFVTKITFH